PKSKFPPRPAPCAVKRGCGLNTNHSSVRLPRGVLQKLFWLLASRCMSCGVLSPPPKMSACF
ncbi:MAG: hypothetical protein VXW32_03900, partial [Myxococcota bacterium]|nr:hypothetical protein [Myxococcota bacterium]